MFLFIPEFKVDILLNQKSLNVAVGRVSNSSTLYELETRVTFLQIMTIF